MLTDTEERAGTGNLEPVLRLRFPLTRIHDGAQILIREIRWLGAAIRSIQNALFVNSARMHPVAISFRGPEDLVQIAQLSIRGVWR